MLISAYESRKDWPLIVESVACPVCGVSSGPCRNLSAAPGTLLYDEPRRDWHQERRQQAIRELMAHRDKVREESSVDQ